MSVTKLVIAGVIDDVPLLETISSFPNLRHFSIKTVRSATPEAMRDNDPPIHPHLRMLPHERFENLTYLCLGDNYSWNRIRRVLERCVQVRCLRLGIFEEMGQLFYPFRPTNNQQFLSNISNHRNIINNAHIHHTLQDVTQHLDNIFLHNEQLMYLAINSDNDDERTWELYDQEVNSIPDQPQQPFVPGLRVFDVDQLLTANRVFHMQHVDQNTLTNLKCAMTLGNETLLQDVTSFLLQNAANLTNLTSLELFNINCSSVAIVDAINRCPNLQTIAIEKWHQRLDDNIVYAIAARPQLRHVTIIHPEGRRVRYRSLSRLLETARQRGILETFKTNRFNQNILVQLTDMRSLRSIHLVQTQISSITRPQATNFIQGLINNQHPVQVLEITGFDHFFTPTTMPHFLAQVAQLPSLVALDFCGHNIQNLNIFHPLLQNAQTLVVLRTTRSEQLNTVDVFDTIWNGHQLVRRPLRNIIHIDFTNNRLYF